MSKYKKHVLKLRTILDGAITEYRTAEERLADAREQARKYPERPHSDPEYTLKSSRAKCELLLAKDGLAKTKRALSEHKRTLASIRNDLATELDADFVVNPESLDLKTLELIKSGILKPADYERLMANAKAEGNVAMVRIIGKNAGEAAGKMKKAEDARRLRTVEFESHGNDADEKMAMYDSIAGVAARCLDNPSMAGRFDEICGDAIGEF